MITEVTDAEGQVTLRAVCGDCGTAAYARGNPGQIHLVNLGWELVWGGKLGTERSTCPACVQFLLKKKFTATPAADGRAKILEAVKTFNFSYANSVVVKAVHTPTGLYALVDEVGENITHAVALTRAVDRVVEMVQGLLKPEPKTVLPGPKIHDIRVDVHLDGDFVQVVARHLLTGEGYTVCSSVIKKGLGTLTEEAVHGVLDMAVKNERQHTWAQL